LLVAGKEIGVVELPSPKENYPYPEGLEHLEIVVSDLESFKEKYAHLLDGEETANSHNPTLLIHLGPSRVVKFHRHSLLEVIAKEGILLTKC
jgi:predicted metalloenzyme YecM